MGLARVVPLVFCYPLSTQQPLFNQCRSLTLNRILHVAVREGFFFFFFASRSGRWDTASLCLDLQSRGRLYLVHHFHDVLDLVPIDGVSHSGVNLLRHLTAQRFKDAGRLFHFAQGYVCILVAAP